MAELHIKKCATCSNDPPAWQYKCRECKNVFEMPAPSGPTDEKDRKCPACRSHNIERVSLVKSEACPPGG